MKKKVWLYALIPSLALAGGVSLIATSCSKTSTETPTVNPNSPIKPSEPTPAAPVRPNPIPTVSASPTANLPNAIDLDNQIETINNQVQSFKKANNPVSLFNTKQTILKTLNQNFSSLVPGYDVVFDINYDLETNGNIYQINNLKFQLNPSFNYNLLQEEHLKYFSFDNETKILTYRTSLNTSMSIEPFNPGLNNFDPNTNNQYQVYLKVSNSHYLTDKGLSLDVICPSQIPSGFSLSQSQLSYQVYYAADLDATKFSQFEMLNSDSQIVGALSDSFSLGQKLHFEHLNKSGIYLINFKFSQGQQEVNLLCGTKVFDQLNDVSTGSYDQNRSFNFELNDTVTTDFNIGRLGYNGVPLSNQDYKQYHVIQKHYRSYDLSEIQRDGLYNFNVTYQDTNPLTSLYTNSTVYNLTTNVLNPLKGLEFVVNNQDYFNNTATLSLQQTTKSLYGQGLNNDNVPALIDSVNSDSKQAIVNLYQQNQNDANKTWEMVSDVKTNNHFSHVTNLNTVLNRKMPVSITLNKDSIAATGTSYLLAAASGNGYRFNFDQSQYFMGYQAQTTTDWTINKSAEQLALPAKNCTYQMVKGHQLDGFANDANIANNAVIIGSQLQFSASVAEGVSANDIAWQYQVNNGQWIDLDSSWVSINQNQSLLTIPSEYNTQFNSFKLRAISKSWTWVPANSSEEYIKTTTPKSIFAITNKTLNGFVSNFGDDKQQALSAIYLPDSCNTTKPSLFANKNTIKGVYVPSSYTSLGNNAFNNCANLKFVDLNQSKLTAIPNSCFKDSRNLQHVYLDQTKIATVNNFAFQNTGLKEFIAPATLTRLCEDSMQIKAPQYDVDLSKCHNVRIDKGAFWESTGLNNLYGTQNISNYGENTFYNTKNMNPNGNGCYIIGEGTTTMSVKGCLNTNSNKIKYLVIDSNQFNYVDKWFGTCPNLTTILFKTQAIADKWTNQGKAKMVGMNNLVYSKKSTYQNYIVYQTPNGPDLAILTPNSSHSTSQVRLATDSTNTNNGVRASANIDLSVTIPSHLPYGLAEVETSQVVVKVSLFYAPGLDETNLNNFRLVGSEANDHQVSYAQLGISQGLAAEYHLGDQIHINHINAKGSYLVYLTYVINDAQYTGLVSQYNQVMIAPVIPNN